MKTVRFLFSDSMARAIVEGRKTVTRRPVVPQPEAWPSIGEGMWRGGRRFPNQDGPDPLAPCAPGDLLIGRECWAAITPDPEGDDIDPVYEYRADHNPPLRKPGGWEDAEPGDPDMVHWRPSIHMPDAAARIRRQVISVTVERLHDLDEDEAAREGFSAQGTPRMTGMPNLPGEGEPCDCGDVDCPLSSRMEFACAWISIYAAKGLGWDANPWVWRIEFSAENVEATP